ncbi:MAG: TrmB family transcriptional regulator [Minisyncoccales bacterium]
MEDFLQSIGLTKLESKVYVSLLDEGELKVSKLLAVAKLNSGRIYDILDSLQQKGFISVVVKDGIKYVSPSPPEILRKFMDEKEQRIKNQRDEVEKILPLLSEKYFSSAKEGSIEIFTGRRGLEASYKILFAESEKDKNLLITGSSTQLNSFNWIAPFFNEFIYPQRRKLKIKKILDNSLKKEDLVKDGSQIKYLDFSSITSFEVLGNVVVLQIISHELICIVMRSELIADDFRKQFEVLWKKAKK